MATLVREFTLTAPAQQVWDAVADVGGVNRLIDFLGEVTVDGDIRSCQLGDAGALRELIVSVDHDLRRLAYSIQASPFGFTHHHASMQVTPVDDATSRFTWITDVAPDTLAGAVTEPVDTAVDSIKRHFA
ncbi:SRPBCC family protein [Kineosporia sp. R_H_3]|uniref:SRPBCC family protein n=1 Tax=Kineosporia sp. R_H_3 TaxID=1961848 RepID=UPI00130407F2|nr:SRPBCC family protein [Kineosporia sp. R_H_3]